MLVGNKKKFRFARIVDTLAEWLISVSGVAVILAMFAMLILIVAEAAPLFLPASQSEIGRVKLPDGIGADQVLAVGADSDLNHKLNVAGFILKDGRGGFARFGSDGGSAAEPSPLPGAPKGASILSVEAFADGRFSVLWSDHTLSLVAMRINFATAADGGTTAEPAFTHLLDVPLGDGPGAPAFAMLRGDESAYAAVAVYPDGSIVEKRLRQAKGLGLRKKAEPFERKTQLAKGMAVGAAALNTAGNQLYLGTGGGDVISVAFPDDPKQKAVPATTPAFRDRRAVTALAFLNGDYAVAIGDAMGGVSVWFPRREGGEFRFRRSVSWPEQGGGVTDIVASRRDRGFFVLDQNGGARWLYSTNDRELLDMPPTGEKPTAAAINARADTLALLDADGALDFRRLDGRYPEAGWSGFFGRLLYEGYDRPAFVWQSTGSDASEPKLSLVPLIWGSFKGAAYALVFAAPIALAAAMYLSQFARPEWRARLKPAVEMLAAVPSVVVGFIAALWLAPLLERHLQFVVKLVHYDQRNCLVIAIAMGFAVIPTIFSLAEDAISAVPPSLSAASLALGASKWQTVKRVVIPSASPGIFTAIMLGFGRAVGETMIVLMATGNTPIISLSPFDGMRTLSANIAVEMPEAPVGGTLYRTLFLCALVLFLFTLVINTGAELMRHGLRRRYGRF